MSMMLTKERNMSAVNGIAEDVDALDRLKEVCGGRGISEHDSKIDMLLHNDAEYIFYQRRSIEIFNKLKAALAKEQLDLLKDYEEAQAGKEIAFKRII